MSLSTPKLRAMALSLPLLLAATACHANDEARETFLKAEQALARNELVEFSRLERSLDDYPLQPYLRADYLLKNLGYEHEGEIADFIDADYDAPRTRYVNHRWLRYLARKGDQERLTRYYRASKDATVECNYLLARLAQGIDRDQIFTRTTDLWKVGKSQPKACDPLFKLWREAGYLTSDIAYERLVIAASRGQVSLANYLRRYLEADQQYLANLWARARRSPSRIHQANFFPGKNPREADIAAYALQRIIWGTPDRALATWDRLDRKLAFSDAQRADITRTFALALGSDHHPQSRQWLDAVPPSHEDSLVWQWRLAYAGKAQDWELLDNWLARLEPDEAQKPKWVYWRARILMARGQQDPAEQLLQTIAHERDYYGYLAAAIIGQPPNLGHRPLQIDQQLAEEIALLPAAQRSFELLQLERLRDARREWLFLTRDFDTPRLEAAAHLAFKWGWHEQAIFTLARAKNWDDLDMRFPLAHKEDFIARATAQKIEPSWAIAVARQESAFTRDAISPAGAYGLMQIMPGTAKTHARQYKLKYRSRSQLLNPDFNIRFGVQYLDQLQKQLGNNPILASAAYNAGKHRVDRWIDHEPIAADIWIENIPFHETRRYIKNVMTYRAIYNQLLKGQDDIFGRINEMQIGRTEPAKSP